ncbi:MAG: hypothetical protein JW874_05880 [Spirochaetales bacterium]|nr:hypothetical protein [Spirochaetales bacterium]
MNHTAIKTNIILIMTLFISVACGIDVYIYLETPEECPSGYLAEGEAGCVFPGQYNTDVRTSIYGYDVFYSFFPYAIDNVNVIDSYTVNLTVNRVTAAADKGEYPIKVGENGQEYWRVFKRPTTQIPPEPPVEDVSIDPFCYIDSSRKATGNFAIILELNDPAEYDRYYQTEDMTLPKVEHAGTIENIYRWIKETQSGETRILKQFNLSEGDQDVIGYRTKYPDGPTTVQIYFYFFIWGMDSNPSRIYSTNALRVGPIERVIGG